VLPGTVVSIEQDILGTDDDEKNEMVDGSSMELEVWQICHKW
jgi:hypothetical protein